LVVNATEKILGEKIDSAKDKELIEKVIKWHEVSSRPSL
jgi:F0F1-type ATP synthase membrane subunit b/b'